jgi:hypothetical protein
MTSKVLGIDLHDAGRDGVYRIAPDDPVTLAEDARRAGLHLVRLDLASCHAADDLLHRLAGAFVFPAGTDEHSWDALAAGLCDLHWLPAPGYVLLLDHARALQVEARETLGRLRQMLDGVAKHWHARGVPFFVFLEYPDNETRDAAIDA